MSLIQEGCEDGVVLHGEQLTKLWHDRCRLVSKDKETCARRHVFVQPRWRNRIRLSSHSAAEVAIVVMCEYE